MVFSLQLLLLLGLFSDENQKKMGKTKASLMKFGTVVLILKL